MAIMLQDRRGLKADVAEESAAEVREEPHGHGLHRGHGAELGV